MNRSFYWNLETRQFYFVLFAVLSSCAYNVVANQSGFKFELYKTLTNHTDEVKCLLILSDDSIASGSKDLHIKIWNSTTGSLIKTLAGHKKHINSLAVLENGHLISGSHDNTIKIWNTHTGDVVRTIDDEHPVNSLAVLRHDSLAAGSQNMIKIWDTETGFLITTLDDHKTSVVCLVVLPTSNLLASGSSDKTIKLWDLYTYELKSTLAGHTSGVNTLVAMPNGLLASGSWDSTIKIWNVANNESAVQTLQSDQIFAIRSLTALRNGCLVSGSYDFSIYVWNTVNGTLMDTLTEHSGWISALTTLPNGYLVSGSSDNTIKIWKKVLIDNSLLTTRVDSLASGLEFSISSKKRKMVQTSTLAMHSNLQEEMKTIASSDLSYQKLTFTNVSSISSNKNIKYNLVLALIIFIKWLI